MQIHAYRRTAAIVVTLFGLDVHFAPNPAGHVVADVEHEGAVERLLSISEAYKRYNPATAPVTVSAPSPVAAAAAAIAPAPAPVAPPAGQDDAPETDVEFDAVLIGSEALPATFDVAGVTYTQAQVVDLAFARSGMNREEWNLNDEDDREGLIEGEVTQLILAAEQAAQKAAAEKAADASAPAPAPAPAPAAAPGSEVNPLIITNGEETLDLGTLSAAKLREFATANGIELPGGNSTKVGDLRLMVAKAVNAA